MVPKVKIAAGSENGWITPENLVEILQSFRIGAHAWICTPEEKGKMWKKHRKVRCSSSKCKKFVLFSDHFCAHCGEANEKFDPVEKATNKEGQRTGWLGKRPGEFDPKSWLVFKVCKAHGYSRAYCPYNRRLAFLEVAAFSIIDTRGFSI